MYQYDPYGNVIQALGSHSQINPLRYRGYYYDNETELYYLQSRYYDPKIGRFINADSYTSTGQGFIGYNMFAYCGNNPANYCDPTGHFLLRPDACYSYLGDDGSGGRGGGGGGGGILLGLGLLIEDFKDLLLTFGTIAIAIQTTLESTNNHGDYYVYVLADKDNSVQYVGRTKHPGPRESAHNRNPFRHGLKFEIVGSKLNYEQARGLEQVLMLYYHTLNIRDPKNNQINGISPKNDSIDAYLEAARGTLGYLWNQLSNDVLNWVGQ